MVTSRRSGVSWSTLYRAEVGGVVTQRTAERLARVFGVRVEDILGVSPLPAPPASEAR